MPKTVKRAVAKKIFGQTVSVLSSSRKMGGKYLKPVKSEKKYLAEKGDFAVAEDDVVLIEEIAPVSKRKSWKIKGIIEKK